MQEETTPDCSRGPLAIHPLDAEDAAIAAAMRVGARWGKGVPLGVNARSQYDALTGSNLALVDLKLVVGGCGGISGLWVLPADWRPDEVIVHLHGCWFIFGSAAGYG